jgi:hypothetical protein
LARWLQVGSVQDGRTQEAPKEKRQQRRDSDESEKSQENRWQEAIEGRRGTERSKAIAESAAAAAAADPQVLIAAQSPRKKGFSFFRGFLFCGKLLAHEGTARVRWPALKFNRNVKGWQSCYAGPAVD